MSIETFGWNYSTGELAWEKDQNGNQTSFTYNDSLARLTTITTPGNGVTNVSVDSGSGKRPSV